MFAQTEQGWAYCIEAFGDIHAGATVPPVNELWEQVQQSVALDGWQAMPEITDNSVRIAEIVNRFEKIERESLRPLIVINNGTDVQFDRDKLAALETEAQTLRDELNALGGLPDETQ
ncbi:MAG: hypothetical protein LC637_05050 [Xanthomonadaceae bacterium]|nr:hypothetical protein [Xanthomonadaceae bacterium]